MGVTRNEVVGAAMDELPQMACTTCTLAEDCPEFRDGYLCAYNDLFKGLSVRNVDNIFPIMQKLVDIDMQRTMMAVLQERLTAGGQLDSRVSSQLSSTLDRLQQMRQLHSEAYGGKRGARLSVEERGGRVHVEAEAEGEQGRGFLARLFGAGKQVDGMDSSSSRTADVEAIDVEVVPGGGVNDPGGKGGA